MVKLVELVMHDVCDTPVKSNLFDPASHFRLLSTLCLRLTVRANFGMQHSLSVDQCFSPAEWHAVCPRFCWLSPSIWKANPRLWRRRCITQDAWWVTLPSSCDKHSSNIGDSVFVYEAFEATFRWASMCSAEYRGHTKDS